MVERVTLLYNGGSVTVAKYSRIKVYHQSLGSIKGFIVGFDDEKITLVVPDDFIFSTMESLRERKHHSGMRS